jgi:hypothetical protein
MLDLLRHAIRDLPDLMRDRAPWSSIDVTYHAPRVKRIWRQWGENRILLHRIYPCEPGEALFHPHPWPSAVRIVSGRYEMRVSSLFHDEDGQYEQEGPAWTSEHVRLVLGAGSEYEMIDRNGWHSVRPLDKPSDSVMVTGPVYEPKIRMPLMPPTKQEPLEPTEFDALFGEWRDRLDPPVECGTCGWRGRRDELECYRDDHGRPVEQEYVRCPHCFDEDQVWSRR